MDKKFDMDTLPRLKIRLPSQNEEPEICSLEEAGYRFNWGREPFLIVVEGQFINSYDDLLELARQDRFKGKLFLEVEIQPLLAGG